MSAKPGEVAFGQDDYKVLTSSLDTAMAHLKTLGMNERAAQAYLQNFVEGHYFPVWRAMHPDGEDAPAASVFARAMVADPACPKCGGRGEAAVPASFFCDGPVVLPCDCRRPK